MKKKFFLILLLCTGCATTYSERGFFGTGYSEIRTNPDTFIVTFKGNAATYRDDVTKYALLRAAELTLQNGYKYFVVLASEDRTSSYDYVNTDTKISKSEDFKSDSAKASTSTTSGTVVHPGTSLRIQCFEEKPLSNDAIDAVFYWNANSPK